MKGQTVEQSDLIGEIKDFPIEVVQAMVNEQVRQGNKANVTVFQRCANRGKIGGGFDWDRTPDGSDFWHVLIFEKRFSVFFAKYPKDDAKKVTIDVPDGYEIDNEKSTFTNIIFKPIENKHPKAWEDAFIGKPLCGYWIGYNSEIKEADCDATSFDRNVFKTKKQAESALAYAQLTQLMAHPLYNGDWEQKEGESCFAICYQFGLGLRLKDCINIAHILTFKSFDVAKTFLNNHKDLLLKYFQQ